MNIKPVKGEGRSKKGGRHGSSRPLQGRTQYGAQGTLRHVRLLRCFPCLRRRLWAPWTRLRPFPLAVLKLPSLWLPHLPLAGICSLLVPFFQVPCLPTWLSNPVFLWLTLSSQSFQAAFWRGAWQACLLSPGGISAHFPSPDGDPKQWWGPWAIASPS